MSDHDEPAEDDELKEFTVRFKIEVIDQGQGIPECDLPNLFMDFSKLDQHEHINKQGTGLGLSICKRIIEEMGGQVTVSSQVGEGTTFVVSICTTMRAPLILVQKLLGQSMSNKTAFKKTKKKLEKMEQED